MSHPKPSPAAKRRFASSAATVVPPPMGALPPRAMAWSRRVPPCASSRSVAEALTQPPPTRQPSCVPNRRPPFSGPPTAGRPARAPRPPRPPRGGGAPRREPGRVGRHQGRGIDDLDDDVGAGALAARAAYDEPQARGAGSRPFGDRDRDRPLRSAVRLEHVTRRRPLHLPAARHGEPDVQGVRSIARVGQQVAEVKARPAVHRHETPRQSHAGTGTVTIRKLRGSAATRTVDAASTEPGEPGRRVSTPSGTLGVWARAAVAQPALKAATSSPERLTASSRSA